MARQVANPPQIQKDDGLEDQGSDIVVGPSFDQAFAWNRIVVFALI